jgi:hypothetical protein
MIIRSMPPISAHYADRPVPSPQPMMGLLSPTDCLSLFRYSSRVIPTSDLLVRTRGSALSSSSRRRTQFLQAVMMWRRHPTSAHTSGAPHSHRLPLQFCPTFGAVFPALIGMVADRHSERRKRRKRLHVAQTVTGGAYNRYIHTTIAAEPPLRCEILKHSLSSPLEPV